MRLQILLVEDDAELRREMIEYLSRRLHTVTAVGTFAEAKECLGRSAGDAEKFDSVLCDFNLGDGSGIDLFTEFALLHPSCHWILMSGDPDPEHLEAAQRRFAGQPRCTIVSKPVSLRNLATLVASRPQD